MAGNGTVWENGTITSTDSVTVTVEEQVRLILPYSIILLLAVIGNGLVIVTLAVNKRMRTVTNVFLLTLSISDLLLGVFCMPFTLAGVLLRKFIFGEVMCRLIPYLQAVSVSVSAWTLVVMSIERYYAIRHPLKSREWQTLSHAYRMIAVVWTASLICMLPIAFLSQLQPIRNTENYKCRESWPNEISEKIFNLFLDVILLVVPLLIMIVTYSFITDTLWKTIQPIANSEKEASTEDGSKRQHIHLYQKNSSTTMNSSVTYHDDSLSSSLSSRNSNKRKAQRENEISCQGIRASNFDRSLAQKKRVIKMLFVVVLEFFICWTPLYVINTVSLYDPWAIYHGVGYYGISFFQLLAYTSSCCNPITYCFMNSKFRQSFMALFGCRKSFWRHRNKSDVTTTTFKSVVSNVSYHDSYGSAMSKSSSTKTNITAEK